MNILIAEPCEILRKGLRAIFVADERVSSVYESATAEGLKLQMVRDQIDLVVINQSLVTNPTILPRGHFVILATEPDIALVKAAYKHGARGYVSENISSELLRTILCSSEGSFLIEPTFASYIMESFFGNIQYAIPEGLLTPCEKEIIGLLRGGMDRRTIAKRLNIAETTLKTHIKNMARKRETANQISSRTIS